MSLGLSLQTNFSAATDSAAHYEEYAALLRIVFPTARTIGFYDHASRLRWMNHDANVPELIIEVGKALLQSASSVRESRTADVPIGIAHIVAVRGVDGLIKGAIAIVLERRKYGRWKRVRPRAIEAACAPVARMLGQLWSHSNSLTPSMLPAPAPAIESARPRRTDPFVGAAGRAASAPVLLRRAIADAVNATSCAFGALIASDHKHTLVQRGAEQRQVLAEIRHVIDTLRRPLAAVARSLSEPLIVGTPEASWGAASQYKFAAYGVCKQDGRLAALLTLFRHQHESDFDAAACKSLRDLATRIPNHAIDELAAFATDESAMPEEAVVSAQPEPAFVRPQAVEECDEPVVLSVPERKPLEPSMEKRLRTALRTDGFDLHAQPIASIRDASEMTRYEVLLRLREQDSLQLPEEFLSAADQGGLLPDIDRWVVGRLLNVVRPHLESIRAGCWEFALNVSGASLQRDSFGDFIEAQLFRSAMPPQALVLEFSEHDVLAHRPLFERLAPRLADLGCRVALDNCRQGLDIFLSIGRLPVHRLKIDAALTHHLTSDPRAAHTVRELVEVARDIGIETVGEHIEDPVTCEMLRELGIDFAQGFTIAQPRPLIDLLQIHSRQAARIAYVDGLGT